MNHQTSGHDIDVQTVWESGVTGRNVTVCVIDDGLDHSNADIRPNYVRTYVLSVYTHIHTCTAL